MTDMLKKIPYLVLDDFTHFLSRQDNLLVLAHGQFSILEFTNNEAKLTVKSFFSLDVFSPCTLVEFQYNSIFEMKRNGSQNLYYKGRHLSACHH